MMCAPDGMVLSTRGCFEIYVSKSIESLIFFCIVVLVMFVFVFLLAVVLLNLLELRSYVPFCFRKRFFIAVT